MLFSNVNLDFPLFHFALTAVSDVIELFFYNATLPSLTRKQRYFITMVSNLRPARLYRVAGKSLARPGRKQATATGDFEFHISYL